ncbi:MAG TPA: division plane positioning ATPase MipZ [Rhizomicrobium sp.]|jgi:chromosome partitioning protein|nr:division plane positioning ATPase MipZ [Rhizomicrobium sp.]
MAHVVVFGNEKGGSGKTTAAIHVAVALAREGRSVGVVDLDVRQRSFSRHLENRAEWQVKTGRDLPTPELLKLRNNNSLDDVVQVFSELLESAAPRFEFLVIDTPGADTPLSRAGHAAADTLVTPLNDSFVDFDLLGRIDPATFQIKGPSVYSDFVWDCRKRRLMARKPALDWMVMRNRVASTEARNKKRLSDAISTLAQRIGFRVTKGFGERVIFRELFPMGLTMLDLPQPGLSVSLSMSTLAARQEVRELVHALGLPQHAHEPVALAG